jgi:hypothetical protein
MARAKTNGKISTELADAIAADTGTKMGFEEVTTDDLQMPFVRVLHAMSPQLKKSNASFIEGAAQGDIFNTVTGQVWSGEKGILVLPVYYQLKYIEFVPRSQGGGFVGELAGNSQEVRNAVRDKDTNMEMLESGNELVKTAQHYVQIVHEDGILEQAIIDMKKTQLKKSRLWNSMMMMQRDEGKLKPSFSNVYRLSTSEDSNDKGSWYTWTIKLEGPAPSKDAYLEARGFYENVSSGALRIAAPPQERLLEGSDEIPF